jgi:uncharacterized membrane protein YqjE
METNPDSFHQVGATSKQIARRLAIIVENRLELLLVEVQEERERALRAFLLALGVAAFALLAGVAFTGAIAVWLWAWSPLAVLFLLTGLYGAAGLFLYRQLTALRLNWQTLPASLDQIRKDRTSLEKLLA